MNSTGYLRRLVIFINSRWPRNGIHNLHIFHKADPKISMRSLGVGLNYATVLRSYITVTSILQWSIKPYINPHKILHNFSP